MRKTQIIIMDKNDSSLELDFRYKIMITWALDAMPLWRNKSQGFRSIYDSYVSYCKDPSRNYTKSQIYAQNQFLKYWRNFCTDNEVVFKISKAKGMVIYHNYDSDFLAKK